jgi:hypothetical protein
VIFNTTSDITQKSNIVDIVNAVDTVTKLRGAEFDLSLYGTKSSGVIAQELEKILPHLVSTDHNGIKSVNYAGLAGYFIEAIKELGKEIKELRK